MVGRRIYFLLGWRKPGRCYTVDGRNPKQPPGMYKTLVNNGRFFISTGEFTGFLNHQDYIDSL